MHIQPTLKGFNTINNLSNAKKKSNSKKLPDKVVEQVRKMAKEGALKGVYMGDQFANFCKQYVKENITPDYSMLKSNLMLKLSNTPSSAHNLFGKLFGFSYKMGSGMMNSFISVCDSSGQEILLYDSRNGWLQFPTEAEDRFYDNVTAIYSETYSAAREEMKEQSKVNVINPEFETSSHFEAKA